MRHLRRLGHSLAIAALAAAAIAPLQLLLWPQVELTLPRAVFALAAWTSWGTVWVGAFTFLVVSIAGFIDPSIAARRGFSLHLWRWLALGQIVLVGSVAWINDRVTKEILLQAQRDGLATVAIVCGVAVVLVAATWFERRSTRWVKVLVIGAPVAVACASWASWAAAPGIPPTPATLDVPHYAAARPVLFVSWEGADLPWLLPAIERGDMPFLRERRDTGAWGQLRTLQPFSRLADLATLATGCSPAVHGVIERRAYRLAWLSDQPVSLLLVGPWSAATQFPWHVRERIPTPPPRRATIWEILSRSGLRVGVAGWPGAVRATWEVPPPLASDALPYSALNSELRAAIEPSLKSHRELSARTRTAFAVAAETVVSASLRAADHPVDAIIVDSDLPTRLRPLWTDTGSEAGQEEVLRQALRLLDDQLHTLWSLMGGQDVLLVVSSPYGMAEPTPWRRVRDLAGGVHQWPVSAVDSPDGFVLLSGPGVKPDVRIHGRIADVVPTVLYLLDLPVSRDMAGRVLLEAVTDERAATTPLRLVPSYPAEPSRR
jgi:hypothetical protein